LHRSRPPPLRPKQVPAQKVVFVRHGRISRPFDFAVTARDLFWIRFGRGGVSSPVCLPPLAASPPVGLALPVVDPFGRSFRWGFATLAVLLAMGASLNAIFLGIIGEYVGRIYNQVRQRPNTVIEYTINLDEPAALQPPQLSRSANA